ncbi:hypothetical protein PAXRUDRAFT_822693 [Paxillus rubicundulus Ve08.2h10]|uniref:Pheromone-regulated membrane protein 10 n=1 Tax=Paxillus rubicundulus Ve08.2h10 TaxID=930991 RepID=A0A0D0E4X7_9AGAM|nr:hypothetical protein PAXRUDRAFT_822693 [Paxillus rubicundulus Ve08.2h10]
MTSSSSTPPQNSDEARPAGGTARNGGTRTPRRVQWASTDDVRPSVDPEPSPRSSMHGLDEKGLDPGAFGTLTDALERHRSRESLASNREREGGRGQSNLPAVPPRAAVPLRATASAPASQRSPFATSSLHSWEYHPTYVNMNDPHPNMTAPQTQASESYRTIDSSTQQSTPSSDDLGMPFSLSPVLAQRTHNVPGEVWIDPLEREGLPVEATIPSVRTEGTGGSGFGPRRRSTWKQANDDSVVGAGERHTEQLAEHQAAGVVRAHTRRGWGWLHRSPKGKGKSKFKGTHRGEREGGDEDEGTNLQEKEGKGKGKETKHGRHVNHRPLSDTENDTDFTNSGFHGLGPRPGRARKGVPFSWFMHHDSQRTPDAHQDDPEGHPHVTGHSPVGHGVLSTLLALYGHDHDHDDEGSVSGASTPGRQSGTSSDDESEEVTLHKPHRPWLHSYDDKEHKRSASEGPKVDGGKVDTKESGRFSLGRTLRTGSASSLLSHLRTPSLPTTAASAALIAGAGALSGAAAPQQATLAPNLKRPGYNLVRYSMEDIPTVPPSTPKFPVVPRAPRRTRSTDFDFTRAVGGRVSEEKGDGVESPDTLAATTVVSSPIPGGPDRAFSRRAGDLASAPTTPGGRKRWTGVLKELPLPPYLSSGHFKGFSFSLPGMPKEKGVGTPSESGSTTPKTASVGGTPLVELGEKDYFDAKSMEREAQRINEQHRRERKERKERQRNKEKEMRRKRKKAEVYITRHVAAILQRQEFIMKLARAMMMFGGPTHRLVAQIQSTGRVLDLQLSCMYLPDVMLISFEDSATGTSNVKFIRQGSALDLEKLGEAHALYWSVIHDAMSVSVASASLDLLMRKEPLYNFAQLIIVGGMCSASICSVSFAGSFIDCLASAPLGALLVAIQLLSVRNELYGNVFEITIATLLSFASAALASTRHFCYSAVASSSVVLILPGFIVLCGSLELSSRSLVAGAVRLCFALMYSLFLGFGLAIGAELYQKLVGQNIFGATDYTCVESHDPAGPWWQQTPSMWWAFLTVPMYSLFLSMRLMAPWWKKELILLIAISCIGWVTNHFVSIKFPNQSDISAAVGAFAVGFVSNLYGRFFNGNAFVVMITGILFQVPSGLGNGGLLNFVSDQTSGSSSSYLSGFQTALQLISVAIGLTVGLGISLVIVHPVQSRRRAGGLFSL